MLGDSSMGQLGIGRRSSPNNPTEVSGISNVVKLAVGYFHCIALDGKKSPVPKKEISVISIYRQRRRVHLGGGIGRKIGYWRNI